MLTSELSGGVLAHSRHGDVEVGSFPLLTFGEDLSEVGRRSGQHILENERINALDRREGRRNRGECAP